MAAEQLDEHDPVTELEAEQRELFDRARADQECLGHRHRRRPSTTRQGEQRRPSNHRAVAPSGRREQLGKQLGTPERTPGGGDVAAVEMMRETPLVTLQGQVAATGPLGEGDHLVGDDEAGIELLTSRGRDVAVEEGLDDEQRIAGPPGGIDGVVGKRAGPMVGVELGTSDDGEATEQRRA